MPLTPAQHTELVRQQIAALRDACNAALAYPGNPYSDRRGVALLKAGYHLFEATEIADDLGTLLNDLGLDSDGKPLDWVFGYRDDSMGLSA